MLSSPIHACPEGITVVLDAGVSFYWPKPVVEKHYAESRLTIQDKVVVLESTQSKSPPF